VNDALLRVAELLRRPENVAAITEIAERLLAETSISGDEVHEIIAKHCGDRLTVPGFLTAPVVQA